MSKAEVSPTSETTGNAEELPTQLQNERSRFKVTAIRVVQDGKTVAQRWSRQGLRAAGELAGNAREHIKNDPLLTAAISFVIGLTLGALITRRSIRH